MTIKISMKEAPSFIAGLVREGVTFDANEVNGEMVIKMTGGF